MVEVAIISPKPLIIMEPNRPPVNVNQTQKSNSKNWSIAALVIVVIIIVIIYAATRNSTKNPPMTTDNQDLPAMNTDVLGADRTSVNATPAGLEVTNLQTFPYKVQAQVKSTVPNSCSTAIGDVAQSGNVFTVTVTASQPKDSVCAQVITPVTTTVTVPVAGLAAGTYTVKYGTFSKTFTLAQNNSVDYMTGDK